MDINDPDSPKSGTMDSEKAASSTNSPNSPNSPPKGASLQPQDTPKSQSSVVGGLLRIRRSRKVSAEQDGTSPPASSKKRFLRRSKKNKDNPEDGSASPSASGGTSTPSITPSPSPKPKKSTKASSLVRKLSIGRYRRKTSPANTDTSEDERRAGCVTPPPTSMMPPPEEDESQEGDLSQRAAETVGGATGENENAADAAGGGAVVYIDMNSEPDLGDNAGGEGASSEAVSAPKTPTRSQFLSITTPVITAMQDGLKGELETAPEGEVVSTPVVDNPLEHPLEQREDEAEKSEDIAEGAPVEQQSDLLSSARHKLSQSLGASRNEPAAQYNGEKREHLYKILVIGELGTGKTSIIKRYVHQFFSQHYRATIGVDFALKVLNWDPATIVRLQLWDIAGQERFGNMTRVYYKEAVGAFIVFDVTRAATFDAVLKWKQDLDSKVQMSDGSPIPCVLLANKCDQPKEGIVNTPNKIDEYCNEHGFTTWFETSAKDNVNIDEAARALVAKILQNDRLLHGGDLGRDQNRIALDNGKTSGSVANSNKSCSC